ncbi:unnamed protein product [Closterium sp. NIES-54]
MGQASGDPTSDPRQGQREDPSENDEARAPPLSLRRSSRRQSPRATTGANHGPPSPAVQRPQLHPARAQPTRALGARPVDSRHPGIRPGGQGPDEHPGREPHDHTPESGALPADPQRGAIAAPVTPSALRLTEGAPLVTVRAPMRPEEKEQQAVERDTAPSPVLQPRSQTPYPPQEEPTAGASGSHEQRQMQRELGEGERLTVEGEVQAHRAQMEDGTHALEHRAASCSGSPARSAPVAPHQRQHAVNQPSLLADHTPSHHHDRAPPTSHRDRHATQLSSPGTLGAEENRVAAASSLARPRPQESEADAAGGPEMADAEQGEQQRAAQDQALPGRPGPAREAAQSEGREQLRLLPGPGRQWWRTPPVASPRRQQGQRRPSGRQEQGHLLERDQRQKSVPQGSQGQAEQQQGLGEQEGMEQPASHTTRGPEPEAHGNQQPRGLVSGQGGLAASLQHSPRQTPAVTFRSPLTQRQRALATSTSRQQSPSRGGRRRGAERREGQRVEGGPENAFQAAARRALICLDKNDDPEERTDPSYREEEQAPTSNSEDKNEEREHLTRGSRGSCGGTAA